MTGTWDDVAVAMRASAYSLKALAVATLPLMENGGSLVGLTFDAKSRPVYDWMGVAKAAFESTNRYLARDLCPKNVRANLVSAGPLRSPRQSPSPGSSGSRRSGGSGPLGWDITDPVPAAKACAVLLSDWFPATTGEIIHVDGGVHVAGAVRTALSRRR